MAEYYPLLAKAVGSLPNSTPETRRVVYERARKALIGQLRTLHPPIPDEDIERESVELDRAVQRLEGEIARGAGPVKPAVAAAPAKPPSAAPGGMRAAPGATPPVAPGSDPAKPDLAKPGPGQNGFPKAESAKPGEGPLLPALAPRSPSRTPVRAPVVPAPVVPADAGVPASSLRSAAPAAPAPAPSGSAAPARPASLPVRAAGPSGKAAATLPALPSTPVADRTVAESADHGAPTPPAEFVAGEPDAWPDRSAGETPDGGAIDGVRVRADGQRPFAPQVPAEIARRKTWIVPVGIAVIVVAVAAAAYLLRDTRHSVRAVPTEPQSAKTDNGKIAERIGRPAEPGASATTSASAPSRGAAATATTPSAAASAAPANAPKNPEVPVAQRAALLIEAPDEPNKVKTFLGSVVWKLNNVNDGPADSVGLAVEADIDMPDDKMKATVTFEKNTDASLPASHTIKVRFTMQPGSPSGDVQQISVPQLRQEDSPSGEALAGVTVPVMQNSFLVGLSPGNAETANIKQLNEMQWIDIPMLLGSGKIAKLTFEKGSSGERDLDEAVAAWQKP